MGFRILQFSFGDGFAGSAKMAILTSEALQNKGHMVTLFASENSLTERRAKENGIEVIALDTAKDFKSIMKIIYHHFEQTNPKFNIVYHSLDRKVGIELKRKYKDRFTNIAYRQNITKSFPIIGSFLYNKYYDYQIACSYGVEKSLIKSGIKKNKIKVIHNCVEVPDNLNLISGDAIRNKFSFQRKIVLGLSSWFHKERKGFDILFKAFSKLNEKFVLLIIGIPENMQNEVNEYAETFGIDKQRIFMPGYVDNIWEYYKAMDIFLLPSRSEGFSLALLEAAAAKLPLIASNIPGNDEFIKEGSTGLLFNIENPEQLAVKINLLSEDKSLSKHIMENAYSSVMNNYLVKNLTERFEEFLKEAPKQNEY